LSVRRTRRRPPAEIAAVNSPVLSADQVETGTLPAEPNSASDVSSAVEQNRVSIRRHWLKPRPYIRFRWLAFNVFLAAIGVSALLAEHTVIPPVIVSWWPSVVIGIALIWLFRSLVRRMAPGLLGSTTLLGLGISLLLATAYQTSFVSVWLGLTLVVIGMGIILRGLLWRNIPL